MNTENQFNVPSIIQLFHKYILSKNFSYYGGIAVGHKFLISETHNLCDLFYMQIRKSTYLEFIYDDCTFHATGTLNKITFMGEGDGKLKIL